MSEIVLQDGDIIVRELRALRHITLNRPRALNAVTLDMAVTMTALLRSWAQDPAVGAILLDGAGERAFCAGGDIRALYDAAKFGDRLPEQFWATEYHLNVMIARYRKPVIAVMDGMVMGGGVGLSAHAAHRVVTERTVVAMPEVGIGFFPDVGASFVLARSAGLTGTHIALTGSRIGAADAIYSGMADMHIAAARLAEFPAALADCRSAGEVRIRLNEMSVSPAGGHLAAARPWIDRCYGANTVEEIVERLRGFDTGEARAALESILKASPTSLKIALRNLRSAVSFKRVEESFQQDYRIALACIAGHDFIEGIRAAIVDKDRKPVWRPHKLECVTPDIVERHFRSVGALELKFAD
ncbi:MAG TPA: enoyl-CoA hydratase/isomerase family protein [Xanthobacteraceae bacterium]|nr:enoyl-CoA hydratase/isomerase family protein [Xanthobacteraceae bacterium]